MLKVLMIGPDPQAMGGIASVEKAVLGAIRPEDANIRFISTFKEGPKLKKLLVAIRALVEYLKIIDSCDLVHVHTASRGSFRRKKVFIDIAIKKNIPVLLHLHGGEFDKWFDEECDDSQRAEIRKVFGSSKKMIVLSEEWREFFLARNICGENQIVVIHNAVPLPHVPVDPSARQDVLFLGRLGARKSPDVLLHAAKALRARFPEARYRFAGDGDVEKYKALANELGVADQCDFLGWVKGEEKEQLVRKSGIFCLPSRHEGMPMSMLEMMAYGLPCVVTPVGGIPQVIRDGENGYMVDVGDSKGFTSRLGELLSDSSLRSRIGIEARKTIEQDFNIEVNVQKLVDLYRELS